jgi:hypothetical protein
MPDKDLDASGVPGYLKLTHQLVERLNEGANPVEAVVTALAGLEMFVRTPVADKILITEKPLDTFPISKYVVGTFEDLAQATNGEVSYGLAAIQRLRVLIDAINALEMKTQELERRLSQLENNGPG